MNGRTALTILTAPKKLVSNWALASSDESSSKAPASSEPALLISTSRRPPERAPPPGARLDGRPFGFVLAHVQGQHLDVWDGGGAGRVAAGSNDGVVALRKQSSCGLPNAGRCASDQDHPSISH